MIIKVTVALVLASSCSCPPTVKPEVDAEAKRAVLAQVMDRVLLPTVRDFALEAEALETSVAAWREARRTTPATAERDAARGAFRAAFLRWQRMEMMAFGPAGVTPTFALGQGLRDTIYSWPTINPCRVDTVLAERLYAEPGFFDTALVTSTGLAALEALLFSDASGNSCAATASINTQGTWAALSAEELGLRRAEYAGFAASGLVKQARLLRDAWVNDAAARFSSAGLAESGFPTAQAALNDVFAGMFEADHSLKDDRLGIPAGLVPTACASVPCPELAEALPSKLSREAIVANLEALRALLRGDFQEPGHGFDVLLEARGAGSLALEMDAALVAALARAQALPAPVDQSVVTQLGEVQQLHAAVKAFTDLLKSQFVTVLSLQVPAEGAGDAD